MANQTRPPGRLARRKRALEALHTNGLDASSQLDVQAALRRIMESAVRLLEGDGSGTYLYEEGTGLLRVVEAVGQERRLLGQTLKPGEGLIGQVFATGQMAAVTTDSGLEGRLEVGEASPCQAVACAPLRWQDQIIGAVALTSNHEGRIFDEDDMRLLELIAAQAATAIGSARLYQAERRDHANADALLEALRALSSTLSLRDTLQAILHSCQLVLPLVSGSIMTFEEGVLHLAALLGYDGREDAIIQRSEVSIKNSPILKQMIRDHLTLIIPDVRQHADWIVFPETEHIRGWMGVPLLTQDELIGVLSLESDQPGTYTSEHARLAEVLGAQAAVALVHARLFAKALEAEARFRDMANSLSDWLWETDVRGRIIYCSEQVEQVTGYPVATVMGHTLATFLVKEDSGRIGPLFGELARRPGPFSGVEFWLRHKQGHPICIRVSGVPVYDSQGSLTGFRGAAKDATTEKKAQQREQLAFDLGQKLTSVLSMSELARIIVEQLITTFGYYHVTFWEYDRQAEALVVRSAVGGFNLDKRIIRPSISLAARPSIIARAARERQVVVSNDVRSDPDYLHSDLLPDTRAEVSLPLVRGDRLIGVLDVLAKEPYAFPEDELRALQIIAAQATIAIENARLYERLSDQTDRLEELVTQRTQDVVRERERLQAIVEHAGEGIIFTDARGRIEYVNDAWEKITGFAAQDVIGKRTTDVFAGEAMRGEQTSGSGIGTTEVWHGELHLSRPDGSEYIAGVTTAPVINAQGHLLNVVGVMHDITARKHVEQMRNKFVANVSHELRTPLTNLKLYHTLVSAAPDDKRPDYLATMGEQIDRIERLVEDLLDVSRLDRGVVELHPEEIDLNNLVDGVIKALRLPAERHGQRITADLAPDLPPLQADHHRLAQVLNNLLNNAINYSSEGETVVVKTWHQTRDRDFVAFSVKDRGIGIAPEDLPFVFDRFFRSETAKSSGIPGTGLGLSIVRDIVELHRGEISVETAPGQGSTFTVRLPVR